MASRNLFKNLGPYGASPLGVGGERGDGVDRIGGEVEGRGIKKEEVFGAVFVSVGGEVSGIEKRKGKREGKERKKRTLLESKTSLLRTIFGHLKIQYHTIT